jgi:hypothetical protein
VSATDLRPDGGAAEPPVDVVAVVGGMTTSGMFGGGCPNGFNVIRCSYSFYGYPGLDVMTLQVSVGSSAPVSKDIPLMPFNYCGNNLAYVSLIVSADSSISIGDPSYVSPCRSL